MAKNGSKILHDLFSQGWKHIIFFPAPAIVLITKGRLLMLLHLQPLPAIFIFIAPRTPSN